MSNCLVLNSFTMVVLVVVLPLFALHALERRRRHFFLAQLRQEREQREQAVQEQERRQYWWMWNAGDSIGGGGGSNREEQQGGRQRQGRRRPRWRGGEHGTESDDGAEAEVDEATDPNKALGRGSSTTLFHIYLCACLAWAGSACLAAHTAAA